MALTAVVALVEAAAAQEIAGTWVPQDANAEILARQPQNVRVLAIRAARGGLIGKLIVPMLAGVPVAVEQHGDRVRLAWEGRPARGLRDRRNGKSRLFA